MATQKSIDRKNALNAEIPDPTLGIFVRSASVANPLAATLVFIEFSAMAILNHDGITCQLGLSLADDHDGKKLKAMLTANGRHGAQVRGRYT
jgi:hypothetical protein